MLKDTGRRSCLFKLYSDSSEIKGHIDRNIIIFNGSQGDTKSFDLLEGLLDEQVWRLPYWRVATEEINYRKCYGRPQDGGPGGSGEMDGRIKLYLTYKALNYRRENRLLFAEGSYIPLPSDGNRKDNLCSFARKHEEKSVLVVVPRFVTELVKEMNENPFGEEIWGETWIVIPDEISAESYLNTFTGEKVEIARQSGERILSLADILTSFPVAMLEGDHER